MKILQDDDVIEVGDILLFGYGEEEPTIADNIMIALGFAGETKAENAPEMFFALRMSPREKALLRNALDSETEDG